MYRTCIGAVTLFDPVGGKEHDPGVIAALLKPQIPWHCDEHRGANIAPIVRPHHREGGRHSIYQRAERSRVTVEFNT